jgi:methylglyoxal synthase
MQYEARFAVFRTFAVQKFSSMMLYLLSPFPAVQSTEDVLSLIMFCTLYKISIYILLQTAG